MFTIDGSGVLSFAKQLSDVPKDMRPGLRKGVIRGADMIAGRARINASWSTRIPGAIKARARFGSSNAVQVVVDAKKAPHARAFEGIAERGGTFRHPVFGRDTWVEQQQRPFLVPAVQEMGDEAVREIRKAIDSAFSQL